MTPPQSSWPSWLPSWPLNSHSTDIEHRITRLEVHKEDQEEINDQVSDRMKWLERGLQALATLVLILITKQAPTSAAALADVLLAIFKR